MPAVNRSDMNPSENEEMLAAARVGDLSARWSALESCRAYLRLVVGKYRWSVGVGGPATSDLVQDAMLDGWRGFGRFEGRTQGQLRAWLRAILVHSLIKERRQPVPARLGYGDGDAPIADVLTPPSRVVQREESDEVIDAAMRALPEHYRAAIRWRLWEDLSFAEIGARLEISDDCAQKLYGRAIARLRELLGPGHELG